MQAGTQMGLAGMAERPHGAVTAAPAALLSALSQPDLPPLVRHWSAQWPQYAAAMRMARRMVDDLRKEEHASGHRTASAWKWSPLSDVSIADRAVEVLEVITTYAREELCGGDKRVFSDEESYEILTEGKFAKNPENPDFVGYWEALVRRFGGGAGVSILQRQAAHRLRKELRIFPDNGREPPWARRQPPKMERGGVTFDLGSHWVERRYQGGYEVTSSGSGQSRNILKDLAAVLGSESVSPEHASVFARQYDSKPGFDIPHRREVAGWRWTLYKERATLWVPQETAIELRARLDDLAPDDGAEPCE